MPFRSEKNLLIIPSSICDRVDGVPFMGEDTGCDSGSECLEPKLSHTDTHNNFFQAAVL